MSPREILAGLEARLDELGAVRRQSPAHHRSVRAAVEWSHQLLDPTEQEAFRHLAVFVGGFDAQAAKAVAPGLSPELLARLVDKSVVTVMPGSPGRTRYRMLETVREYAHELLVAGGELDVARQRHFRHFLSLGNETREASGKGGAYSVWPPRSTGAHEFVDELEADYGNVRAALEWAAVADPCAGLRLLAAMMDLFLVLGQADGRRLAEVVLERCPARDLDRVNVQISAGALAWWTGDPQAARRVLTEARELSVELGERAHQGWAWIFEGLVEVFGGSAERARRNFEEGRRLHHELGVRAGEARSSAAIGLTFMLENDSARAQKLVEEALELAVAVDDGFGQGQCPEFVKGETTFAVSMTSVFGEERAAAREFAVTSNDDFLVVLGDALTKGLSEELARDPETRELTMSPLRFARVPFPVPAQETFAIRGKTSLRASGLRATLRIDMVGMPRDRAAALLAVVSGAGDFGPSQLEATASKMAQRMAP